MRSLLKLNKYFFRYKYKLAMGILFIILSNVSQVYIPQIIRESIDELHTAITSEILLEKALLIIGIALISGFFRFLIRQTIIVVSREIEYDIRQDFWTHIQKLPMRYFQNNSTGNIMAHATNDISAVRMYVGPAVMYSIDTITTFSIVIAIMISINPLLTLYSLLPLPLLSYVVYRLSKKIHTMFTKIQEKFSEITTKVQENLSGIRVIKSYVREQSEIESFTKLNYEYLESNMDKVKVQALFMPILFLITGISIIVVVWIGGTMVIDEALTLGDIVAYVFYLGMLIWPTIALGWIMNILQQASASMKRLLMIWAEDEEIKDTAKTKYDIKDIKGSIKFDNVTFSYGPNLNSVLKNISFEVPAGGNVAIVGHTGVGKTSLINLIPRLYDITEGSLLIDGKEIDTIPLNILRKNIGIVPQETFLFSDTITSNISYGLKTSGNGIIEEVADISQLKDDVDEFPNGFDTILGERGITLSGGQKQRTCLARALAINPKILILDDSFSAVDTNTEEEILIRLKNYMKGRTTIIISHRISTVKDSDKILVLDQGKVVEEGTHEDLVKLNGIYADLHYKQLLEDELKELN